MQVREQLVQVKTFVKPSLTSTSINSTENLKCSVRTEERIEEQLNEKEQSDSLYTRLQQEAEKIRKWKVQTGIELKQKERKLHEATCVIESLRKSTLELQIQNESLSLKLQEELANREEIKQKIGATRNMCTVLKEYTSKVEDRLAKCETEHTDLKFVEKEYIKQFEGLSADFKQMSITSTEAHTNLVTQLQYEKNERELLERNHENQLAETNCKVESLLQECEAKNNELNMVNAELSENQGSCRELQQCTTDLQKRLETCECTKTELEHSITIGQKELETARVQEREIENRLDETSAKLIDVTADGDKMKKEFGEQQEQFSEKQRNAEEEITSLQAQLLKATNRNTELQTNLTKAQNSVEDLKSSKDMLIVERTDVRKGLEEVEIQKRNLTQKLEEQGKQLQALSVNRMSLIQDFATQKEAAKKLQADLSAKEATILEQCSEKEKLQIDLDVKCSKLKDDEEKLIRLKIELDDVHERERDSTNKLAELQDELANKRGEHLSTCEENEKSLQENKELQKDVNCAKKDLAKMKRDLEKSATKEVQTKGKLEKALEENKSLRNKVADAEKQYKVMLEESKANLLEEKENADRLKHESNDHQHEASSLQDKIKELTAGNVAKNKQIKQLEKDIVKLNNAISENNNAREALNKQCGVQMNQMMASLDNCKKESEQALLKKEKELDQLKKNTKTHVEQEKEFSTLKTDLSEANKKFDHMKNVNLDQQNTVKELQSKLSKLQLELDEKAAKLQDIEMRTATVERTRLDLSSKLLSTPKVDSVLQKSILRQSSSVPKKRRVVFEPSDAANTDSDSIDAEIGVEDLNSWFKERNSDGGRIPLVVRQSPFSRILMTPTQSPGLKLLCAKSPNIQKDDAALATPIQRKKRGSQKKDETEIEKFKKLFPEKKTTPTSALHNMRKTRNKSPGRFFNKVSPKAGKKTVEDTAWFESDAVFGFGPED